LVSGGALLREKLALFWHGHFATSAAKVSDVRLLLDQIGLCQEFGLGGFRDLVLSVARDPAMILWLDGNRNRRGQPNENFARELMELFTLGIGHYDEQDIREAARAFTGWHVKRGRFWFNERAHDPGDKQLFGSGGVGDSVDVVDRPSSSRFLAAKLVRFFVHPRPGERMIEALGRRFQDCGGNVDRFLRELLSSRVFYSAAARRAIVASPVDFVVGTLRTLGTGASASARHIADMGQNLLKPPTVKGWDGDRAWVNSGSLLARLRFSMELTEDDDSLKADVPWKTLESGQGEASLDRVLTRVFSGERTDALRREIRDLAGEDDSRKVLALCLQSPENSMVCWTLRI
jgi:uncharacterized protein (DUF1800 family)